MTLMTLQVMPQKYHQIHLYDTTMITPDLTEYEARQTLKKMMVSAHLSETEMYLIASLYQGEKLANAAREIGIRQDNARQKVRRARKKLKCGSRF